MPELPEVETVVRGLSKLIVKKQISKITYDWNKSFPNSKFDVDKFVLGARIKSVNRRAKIILIELDSGYSLVIHLKMTGQLVFVNKNKANSRSKMVDGKASKNLTTNYQLQTTTLEERFGAGHPNDSLVGKLPDKSTRVIFEFSDGSHLFFNDQRKFGWVRLYPTVEVPNIDFMQKLGPEPLGSDFTKKVFYDRIQKRKNSNIKSVILDQTVLAGIGNIYADESLWGAKIHPSKLVKDISTSKINKLYDEILFVLKLAIEKGGSTNRNYVNAEGKKGSYMDFARVFRRENLPCPRCGTSLQKTRVANRGTHYCSRCQRT